MIKSSFVLGISLMDRDHVCLEKLLSEAATVEDAGSTHLIERIEIETRAHFRREEALTRKTSLTAPACHMVQHEMLLGQFRQAHCSVSRRDHAALRSFLVELLPALLHRHINTADRVAAGILMSYDKQVAKLPKAAACRVTL